MLSLSRFQTELEISRSPREDIEALSLFGERAAVECFFCQPGDQCTGVLYKEVLRVDSPAWCQRAC